MRVLGSLLLLASSAGAFHTPVGEPPIPEIINAVNEMLSQFSQYVHYNGPARHVPAPFAKPAAQVTPNPPYWLEQIKHQGVAAFNPNPSYQVFRNVKDFGAQGDGVTDDTYAIQTAISSGNRCGPGVCQSSTITPAVVYFPAGTYVVNSSIIDYYYTQIIGNPNSLPVLKPTANFAGFGVIDGSQYQPGGILGFGPTNTFYRQVRNFIIDLTNIPPSSAALGIHWPTAQATSLQNIQFIMSDAPGTQHSGVFLESGSGGFMTDLSFKGGLFAMNLGNQQFTFRNVTIENAVTAINIFFDWTWTFKSLNINNCTTGIDITSGGRTSQNDGSITVLDSTISNTPVFIKTAHDSTSLQPTGGSVILEMVFLSKVPIAVQGPNGTTALAGTTGSTTILDWGEGHSYTPKGPTNFEGPFAGYARPGPLVSGSGYYQRSKPQYENIPVSQFVSARSVGATGNGFTDDTVALQNAINQAAFSNKVLFVDAGTYKVTKTIMVPPGSRIVGESYSVIMSSGSFFSNMNKPQPVVQVGQSGQSGYVEWSDMIVSTQMAGATPQGGAILIQWNLATSGTPSGMWDVHTRIGGFDGSGFQVAQCPTTPGTATPPAPVNTNCIAAFASMIVEPSAAALYMENVWLWVADHDIDDATSTQITIYAGRGLLIRGQPGTMWLYGTAVEHHQLYQYQLVGTKNIFAGVIQTETPYYQPNPPATEPFTPFPGLTDPNFKTSCANVTGTCADAWGLRIVNSQQIRIVGAGLYSFFSNYSTTCSNFGNGETCQARIFSYEGNTHSLEVFNLNTIGATSMITKNGVSLASYADNIDIFPDTIALVQQS